MREKRFTSQIARFETANRRFELPETAIWGKFLRFGLRDFKSLAICDLEHLALGKKHEIVNFAVRNWGETIGLKRCAIFPNMRGLPKLHRRRSFGRQLSF